MAYQLSPMQRSQLQALMAQIADPSHAYHDQYWRAYQLILDAITINVDGVDHSIPEVESSAWLWFRGATQINQGQGIFSTFIREYTKLQYRYRTGQEASDAVLQEASNSIALNVINDVLANGIPGVARIGEIDAGEVVGQLYGDATDFSSWSGVPLYIFFGENQFFNDHILDEKNGTYDAFALVKAMWEALNASSGGFSIVALLEVMRSITYNNQGAGLTIENALAALDSLKDFLAETYGDAAPGFADFMLVYDIILGKNTGPNDVLAGTGDHEIVHAGKGDDTVIGSGGIDILDGGEGHDILSYAGMGSPVNAVTEVLSSGSVRVIINKGEGGGRDVAANFEHFIGSAYNDSFNLHLLNLGDQINVTIDGGAGDDRVMAFGGEGARLYGGAGSDLIVGWTGGEELLWGGDGSGADDGAADYFSITDGSFVMDAGANDQVYWGLFPLYGGVQQSWQEGGWAYWSPFSSLVTSLGPASLVGGGLLTAALFMADILPMASFRYGQTESGQLVVQFGYGTGWQAVIENYDLDLDTLQSTGNIVVYSVDWTKAAEGAIDAYRTLVKLALKAGFGAVAEGVDPLVIDMDRDGVELTRFDYSAARFDLDGDGFAEKAAWVKGDDGFLVRDTNGNGKIDDVSEMFGSQSQPGFAALAALDSNADGAITSADAAFATLKVWRDLDTSTAAANDNRRHTTPLRIAA